MRYHYRYNPVTFLLKVSTFANILCANIIAQEPLVKTHSLNVNVSASGSGSHSHLIALPSEIETDGLSFVFAEAIRTTLETDSRGRTLVTLSLVGDGKELSIGRRDVFINGKGNVSNVLRMGSAIQSAGKVKSLKIAINNIDGAQTTRITGIHNDMTLRLHTITGQVWPNGPHRIVTFANLSSLVQTGSGTTNWTSFTFDAPIHIVRSLKLLAARSFGILSSDVSAAATTELQLVDDLDNPVFTLDNWSSPAQGGAPGLGVFSASHTLHLDEGMQAGLCGRLIKGGRYRLVVDGSATVSVTPPTIVNIGFFNEFADCCAQPLRIFSLNPGRGGNAGAVTVRIRVVGHTTESIVELVGPNGERIPGTRVPAEDDCETIIARFELRGREPGIWDLVVTNHDGASASLPQAFTIVSDGTAKLVLDIIGPANPRVGRGTYYSAIVRNKGLIDFDELVLIQFSVQSIGGASQGAQAIQILQESFGAIYGLSAGLSQQIPIGPIVFTSDGCNWSARAEASKPVSEQTCQELEAHISQLIELIRLEKQNLGEIRFGPKCFDLEGRLICDKPAILTRLLCPECIIRSRILGNLKMAREDPNRGLRAACKEWDRCPGPKPQECDDPEILPPLEDDQGGGVNIWFGLSGIEAAANARICPIIPRDPNYKSPAGSTGEPAYHVRGSTAGLGYTVYFENKSDASAAAQEVLITDQLDPNLDWETFVFTSIQIGRHFVNPPEGSQSFESTVDLRPELPCLAEIQGTFSQQTGEARWVLRGTDPETGDLCDILPPNTAAVEPQGDGFVSFTCRPKEDLVTGTVIRNRAIIDFEVDIPPEPLETNEVLNTIDADAPDSRVLPLAETQTSTTFEVCWEGKDLGAGISDYMILVSENGGDYEEWLGNTTKTCAVYPGAGGSTYAFYSVAHDLTGNVESPPLDPDPKIVPDAITRVVGSAQQPGDCNQDNEVDQSDAICLLTHVFLGGPPEVLPCGNGKVSDPGNLSLLDWNGESFIDQSDAIGILTWKFLGGPQHVLGGNCVPIAGCPDKCAQ
ncbi:MAG: hypothetical protein HY717_02930 [Planctomycetes bacterium]|nr:hypothetical protein [Planctomycetota bacterium]